MSTNTPKGIGELRLEVEMLREEVAELNKSTRALVDAWNAANSLIKFIKVLSTIMTAIGALYVLLTHATPKVG